MEDTKLCDDTLLEQVLKSEQILQELGPLNPQWFEDLNEQFNQDMFDEAFLPNESCSTDLSGSIKDRTSRLVSSSPTKVKLNPASQHIQIQDTSLECKHEGYTKNVSLHHSIPLFDERTNNTVKVQPDTSQITENLSNAISENVQSTKVLHNISKRNETLTTPLKNTVFNPWVKRKQAHSLTKSFCKGVYNSSNENNVSSLTKVAVTTAMKHNSTNSPAISSVQSTKNQSLLNFTKHIVTSSANVILASNGNVCSGMPVTCNASIAASSIPIPSTAKILPDDPAFFEPSSSVRSNSDKDENVCFIHNTARNKTKDSSTGGSSDFTCTGFKTASNKQLTVTNKSWEKVKSLFEDNDVKSSSCKLKLNADSVSFLGHSNLSMLTETALSSNPKNPVVPPDNQSSTGNFMCTGFKTANQKNVTVSAMSWKKGHQFISSTEVMDHDATSLNRPLVFNKPLYENNTVEAPSKSPVIPPDNRSSTRNFMCTGFKTANRKNVTVSAMSWKKGHQFISSIEVMDHDATSLNRPLVFNKPLHEKDTVEAPSNASKMNFSKIAPSNHKGMRRNSAYKVPRKRLPLKDVADNLPPNKKCAYEPRVSMARDESFQNLSSQNVKRLGVKHCCESQIILSDQSLLKAVAVFENL